MTPLAALAAITAVCDRVVAEGGHRTELLTGVRAVLNQVDVVAGADEYSRGYKDGRRERETRVSRHDADEYMRTVIKGILK